MDSVNINGETYYKSQPQSEFAGDYKIVILQRSWVMIGRFERNGSECKLHNAYVIRDWGTKNGLGELAMEGRKPNTILDKCGGLVEFDYLTVIATISANEDLWKNELL